MGRMVGRSQLFRASWALIDQGLVSLGTFAVNIMLARHLPLAEFGIFAMIVGLLLLLQVINTTLIFFPLIIAMPSSGPDRGDLIWSSVTLLVVTAIPLSVAVIVGVSIFGHQSLVLPVLVWFLAWQFHELMRRLLFSDFRFRAAIAGDAVSYCGQAISMPLLAAFNELNLVTVFTAMAVTSALGALIQYVQLRLKWQRPRNVLATARAHWSMGRWSLANSAVTALRLNALLWLIALAWSPSAVAEFQAALNIANVLNPILHGLCNVIPPTAARAANQGLTSAWRASRPYASLGFIPTAAYYVFIMLTPEIVLKVFYGAGSHYLDARVAVQILGVAFIFNYVSEMICSFLHGINSPQTALQVNLLGSAAVVVFSIPLVLSIGWIGACFALAVANAVRMLLSCIFLKRMIFDASVRAL
jgi:O-antigen/teichoic acid export membrane protein